MARKRRNKLIIVSVILNSVLVLGIAIMIFIFLFNIAKINEAQIHYEDTQRKNMIVFDNLTVQINSLRDIQDSLIKKLVQMDKELEESKKQQDYLRNDLLSVWDAQLTQEAKDKIDNWYKDNLDFALNCINYSDALVYPEKLVIVYPYGMQMIFSNGEIICINKRANQINCLNVCQENPIVLTKPNNVPAILPIMIGGVVL